MAFVYEKIPEADREWFNSFKFVNPITNDSSISSRWTIDRERDIFLIELGGQGFEHSEIPDFYALVWKGNVIMMEIFSGGTGNRSTGIKQWWKITSIIVPKCIIQQSEQIVELIKEAFVAKETGFWNVPLKKAEFKYIASPGYMEVNK